MGKYTDYEWQRNNYCAESKIESVVGNEIQHWMNVAEDAKNNLSENQRNKIINKMESLGEKIKDYPIYQDLLDDEMLRKNGGENNRDLSVN